MTIQEILAIGAGGFIGANLRYVMSNVVQGWVARTWNITLPVSTMFVNITGSCLLALFVVWASNRVIINKHLSLLVITGFFGAYTTFSTFANESITLFRSGDWTGVFTVVVGTNILCFIGVIAGIFIGNWLWPTA